MPDRFCHIIFYFIFVIAWSINVIQNFQDVVILEYLKIRQIRKFFPKKRVFLGQYGLKFSSFWYRNWSHEARVFNLRGLIFSYVCSKVVGFGEEPENQVFLSKKQGEIYYGKQTFSTIFCANYAFGHEMFLKSVFDYWTI